MHPLDHPIWSALTTLQSQVAQSSAQARRFPPEMAVLGALAAPTPAAYESMAELTGEAPVTLYFFEPPRLPAGWNVVRAVELHQMVHEEAANAGGLQASVKESGHAHAVVELTAADIPEMSALYAATRPGRTLAPRIQKLGIFLGIRQEGKLVAMAGLRLQLPGYREITTVGTLPGCEGQGYATSLVSALVARILQRGERPFLTVRTDNLRAMAIYDRLGFSTRARIYSQTVRGPR
jgi:ribosomal protein S18 acetylase RimI-like enzyme